jgi:hypothetical protein
MRITKENNEFKKNYLWHLIIVNVKVKVYYHFCQLIQSHYTIFTWTFLSRYCPRQKTALVKFHGSRQKAVGVSRTKSCVLCQRHLAIHSNIKHKQLWTSSLKWNKFVLKMSKHVKKSFWQNISRLSITVKSFFLCISRNQFRKWPNSWVRFT